MGELLGINGNTHCIFSKVSRECYTFDSYGKLLSRNGMDQFLCCKNLVNVDALSVLGRMREEYCELFYKESVLVVHDKPRVVLSKLFKSLMRYNVNNNIYIINGAEGEDGYAQYITLFKDGKVSKDSILSQLSSLGIRFDGSFSSIRV